MSSINDDGAVLNMTGGLDHHHLFWTHKAFDVVKVEAWKAKTRLVTLPPDITEAGLMDALTRCGVGEYRVVARLANGKQGQVLPRVVASVVQSRETAAQVSSNALEAERADAHRKIAELQTEHHRQRLAEAEEHSRQIRTLDETARRKLDEQESSFKRKLDDAENDYRKLRRNFEDETDRNRALSSEVERVKLELANTRNELERARDELKRTEQGATISQTVRDQIAMLEAQQRLAPQSKDEFSGVLTEALKALLPKLAAAFTGGGGGAVSAPAPTYNLPLVPDSDVGAFGESETVLETGAFVGAPVPLGGAISPGDPIPRFDQDGE